MQNILDKLIEEYDKANESIDDLDAKEMGYERFSSRYTMLRHYSNGLRFAMDLIEKELKNEKV